MTGIVILAAGQSSRMGRPKQQLLYQNQSLLSRTIKAALATRLHPVIVVLGAFADDILPGIDSSGVQLIINPDWEEGMASSIRLSLKVIEPQAEIDQVLILLCDQPHVSPTLINDMLALKQKTTKGIVGCGYHQAIGVPVLFDRKYFAALMLLTGQEGAKKMLVNYATDVAVVDFPLGAVDIDTLNDYQKLIE